MLGNALHGEVHAVLDVALVALGEGVGRGFAFDKVSIGLFAQGVEVRADDRADDTDEADDQVVDAEVIEHADRIENDEGERDGNGGEQRCDDARFLGGVVAALILVARQHDAERTVADPGGNAVNRRAARDLEQGAHDLGEQRADEFEQAEVEQQRQQQRRDDEDDDERGEQVIENKAALTAAGDHADEARTLSVHAKIGEPHEDDRKYTNDDPDGLAGEALSHNVAVHDELGLCQGDQRHDGGDRQDDDAQKRQEAADGARDDVGDDLDHNGPFARRVLDGDHEQDNADDRWNDKQSL